MTYKKKTRDENHTITLHIKFYIRERWGAGNLSIQRPNYICVWLFYITANGVKWAISSLNLKISNYHYSLASKQTVFNVIFFFLLTNAKKKGFQTHWDDQCISDKVKANTEIDIFWHHPYLYRMDDGKILIKFNEQLLSINERHCIGRNIRFRSHHHHHHHKVHLSRTGIGNGRKLKTILKYIRNMACW